MLVLVCLKFVQEMNSFYMFSFFCMIFSGWVEEVRNGHTVLINHTQGKSCPHGSNRSRSSNRLLTSLECKYVRYCTYQLAVSDEAQ